MSYQYVLARASLGKPLRRLIIEASDKVHYLANPDCLHAVESGESDAIGFPVYDVFEFDGVLEESLLDAWREGDEGKLEALWRSARPYKVFINA